MNWLKWLLRKRPVLGRLVFGFPPMYIYPCPKCGSLWAYTDITNDEIICATQKCRHIATPDRWTLIDRGRT